MPSVQNCTAEKMTHGFVHELISGGLIGGVSSAIDSNGFGNGSSKPTGKLLQYDLDSDPMGENKTLYRGITVRENNSSSSLYMTDNYEYATKYSKGNLL